MPLFWNITRKLSNITYLDKLDKVHEKYFPYLLHSFDEKCDIIYEDIYLEYKIDKNEGLKYIMKKLSVRILVHVCADRGAQQ